jgi:hypothetical protein
MLIGWKKLIRFVELPSFMMGPSTVHLSSYLSGRCIRFANFSGGSEISICKPPAGGSAWTGTLPARARTHMHRQGRHCDSLLDADNGSLTQHRSGAVKRETGLHLPKQYFHPRRTAKTNTPTERNSQRIRSRGVFPAWPLWSDKHRHTNPAYPAKTVQIDLLCIACRKHARVRCFQRGSRGAQPGSPCAPDMAAAAVAAFVAFAAVALQWD